MSLKTTRTTAWLVLALVGVATMMACQDASEQKAKAKRIGSRGELIGGPGALGEVGDFLLENDKIRVIIQDKGFSRGFGIYGGSLIDADLVRPASPDIANSGTGRDQFGELFPIFFLQALVPENVELLNDGSDGAPAQVRVVGHGGDFLTLARVLNQLVVNSHDVDPSKLFSGDPDSFQGLPKIQYETIYELEPGARHVRIKARLTNITDEVLAIPSVEASGLLGVLGLGSDIDIPMGTVLLFGGGNKVFMPRSGYDLRFALEESYKAQGLSFPALPGLVSSLITTTSKNGISYGFISEGEDAKCDLGPDQLTVCCFPEGNLCSSVPEESCTSKGGRVATGGGDLCSEQCADPNDPDTEYVSVDLSYLTGCQPNFLKSQLNEDGSLAYESAYPGAKVDGDSMLVPFVASAFTGVFYTRAPKALLPGDTYEYVTYFLVGDGDAASIIDGVHEIRGTTSVTAKLSGIVLDEVTGAPKEGVSVLLYDENDSPANQFFTDSSGRFMGQVAPGRYSARAQLDPVLSKPVQFDVGLDGNYVELSLPTPGYITVRARDKSGRDLPAKVTVVGSINPQFANELPRSFLYDLVAGERWRFTDLIPDDANNRDTLQYIEATGFTEHGVATLSVRPNQTYTVYVSRGLEYDVQRAEVPFITGGQVEKVSTVLTRVVDTTGYISGDFHLHAAPSLDSDLDLTERVVSAAAEGVEFPVPTDHNFVTDYRPYIDREGLDAWMNTMVGLELTTLESGHFNGFPLKRQAQEITKGSFEWSQRTPAEIFSDLRNLGEFGPDKTIVQVNHSRDSILGYFAQFDVDPFTAEAIPPGGAGLGGLVGANGPTFRQYRDVNGNICYPSDKTLADAAAVWGAVCGDIIDGYQVEPNNNLSEAAPLLLERDKRRTTGSVTMCGTDEDWYAITIPRLPELPEGSEENPPLPPPDKLEVVLSQQSDDVPITVTILDQNSSILAEATGVDGDAMLLAENLVVGGTYYIKTAPTAEVEEEEGISYTLRVLVSPDPTSDTIENGPDVTGNCLLSEKINAFSYDFDAMEVINGKLFEQFRTYRMPENIDGLDIPDNVRENLPAPGDIICDGGGDILFPGMVDDWFNLLNTGKMVAGVGNSDSHETEGEEPGYPRTFVRVGKDNPRDVGALEVVEAFQNHRLTLTNGPFVEFFINDAPIGDKIIDTDGEIEARLKVQAPEWVHVNKANVWANGVLIDTFAITMEPNARGGTQFEDIRNYTLSKDTWIVVEVTGNRSLFPVITPLEVPPILLDDAINALTGSAGGDDGGDEGGLSLGSLLGGGDLGDLKPASTRVITSYAITNPIWVDTDGEGFEAPGTVQLECKDEAFAASVPVPEEEGEGKLQPRPELGDLDVDERLPERTMKVVPSMWFPRVKGDMHDVRIIFEQFVGHGH